MTSHMLPAAQGIGRTLESSVAPDRVSQERELARESLCDQIACIIGKDLSVQEIAALSGGEQVLDSIRFEVDKALKKVAGWQLRK